MTEVGDLKVNLVGSTVLEEWDGPDVIHVRGFITAQEVLPNDYLHDGVMPGRVLCCELADVDHVRFTVWTRTVLQGAWQEVRFAKRLTDYVEVTRLVDQDLEPA